MHYYLATKIGDLFCPLIFLDFRTVCPVKSQCSILDSIDFHDFFSVQSQCSILDFFDFHFFFFISQYSILNSMIFKDVLAFFRHTAMREYCEEEITRLRLVIWKTPYSHFRSHSIHIVENYKNS